VAYLTSFPEGEVCHRKSRITTIIRHRIYVPVYLGAGKALDMGEVFKGMLN
jgi:hypothetical protein